MQLRGRQSRYCVERIGEGSIASRLTLSHFGRTGVLRQPVRAANYAAFAISRST